MKMSSGTYGLIRRRLSLCSVIVILMALHIVLSNSQLYAASFGRPAVAVDEQGSNWFREAHFGMFIHWGLYSIPAGEWKGKSYSKICGSTHLMLFAKIPVSEYETLAKRFNPTRFDAEQWVKIAKKAGVKYIVFTAKHHDGFAMYDSKVSNYNVVEATPFGRDPLPELAEACRKEGIRFCLYYSHGRDWHHPDASWNHAGNKWDFPGRTQEDFERYIDEKVKPQMRELLTQYGPVSTIWFDTPYMMPQKKAEELAELVHKIQPNCLVSDRVGQGAGDYTMMGDCAIPSRILDKAWESCDSISDDWGHRKDVTWQNPEVIIRKLVEVTSKGGNYLLNVGPTAEGEIPQPAVDRLAVIGRWMKVNSESIWGTTPSPFGGLSWGCCTAKPGKLYLHVFDWPENKKLVVPGLKNTILKAYLLAEKEGDKLALERENNSNVIISLPDDAPDNVDTVVVLEIKGGPDVEGVVDWVEQSDDGAITLNAIDAKVYGTKLRYQTSSSTGNIGCWSEADEYVTWKVKVSRPGVFVVKLSYSCVPGVGGSQYSLTIAEQELTGRVKETDYWGKFTQEKVGTVEIKKGGQYILTVKPKRIVHGALMNLSSVTLMPAAQK